LQRARLKNGNDVEMQKIIMRLQLRSLPFVFRFETIMSISFAIKRNNLGQDEIDVLQNQSCDTMVIEDDTSCIFID
jgi:hypothetical protein